MADAGETNVPISEWSTGTLKIYHDEKISAAEKAAATEAHQLNIAIKELKTLLDERFIAQEKAIAAALLSQKEAILKAEAANEKRFEAVNEFRAQLSDQTKTFLSRVEYSAAHVSLEDKLTALTDRINRNEGQSKGSDITIGKIYAAIGAVGAILGILVLLANGVFSK